MADENKVGDSKSGGNETNLLNPSTSKKSTGAGYLTFGGAKKGSGNTKKGVKTSKSPDYLNLASKKAFNYLQHTFTKALILQHFDLKWHIQIKTDVSGYAIGRVLSQLTLDDLGQWDPIAYYSRKMITAKTWYKTYNGELLAIVKLSKYSGII